MNKSENPSIGMALWLIKGSLPERVRWCADNGFTAVSLLQSVMSDDPGEKKEAASEIRGSGMKLCYHANFHHKMLPGGKPDADFIRDMLNDVLWWHSEAAAVSCACFDPVQKQEGGERLFRMAENIEALRLFNEQMEDAGVRVGIENSFGSSKAFCNLETFRRFHKAAENLRPVMLFDAGHANIHVHSGATAGKGEIEAYIEAIPFEILEVHVSDNLGEKDEHKRLGYGNLDFAAVVRALKKRGFRGQVTVEVCVDILSGLYAADLDNPAQAEPLLATRESIAAAWRETSTAHG